MPEKSSSSESPRENIILHFTAYWFRVSSATVSAWQPAPPSWPWGWCPSACSSTPPPGPPPGPFRSHMTALVGVAAQNPAPPASESSPSLVSVNLLRHHASRPPRPHWFRDPCQTAMAQCSQEDPKGLEDDPLLHEVLLPVLYAKAHTSSFVPLQVGSIAGFALIIIIAVVGGVLYQSSWVIAPSLWIIGTIFPFIGYSLGFLLARFVGQPWYRYDLSSLIFWFQYIIDPPSGLMVKCPPWNWKVVGLNQTGSHKRIYEGYLIPTKRLRFCWVHAV